MSLSNCSDDNDNEFEGSCGDIWSSMGALSFASPMKDLLDTGNYTIDDLLAEDELLQELRGDRKSTRLNSSHP